MSAFLRAVASRAAPVLRGSSVTQTANYYSKPAKEKVGVFETSIAFVAFAIAILGPSGWIMSHLDDYRNKADS